MGKVMSVVSRKVNRFNVENRAHRVLERDKPVPAPKYESNIRDLERALELDPQLVEKLNRKDTALDGRLRDVYVTSKDTFIQYEVKPKLDDADLRSLPLNRAPPQDFEYGHREPEKVRAGRCTLRHALTFITDHQTNPEEWTAQKIAEQYRLDEPTVVNVLKYFKNFNVYIPDKTHKERILSQSNAKLLKDKSDEADNK